MKPFPSSKGLWFGLLFACLAAAAAANEDASWKSPQFLVDGFVELALKHDYSTRQNPVRKWTSYWPAKPHWNPKYRAISAAVP